MHSSLFQDFTHIVYRLRHWVIGLCREMWAVHPGRDRLRDSHMIPYLPLVVQKRHEGVVRASFPDLVTRIGTGDHTEGLSYLTRNNEPTDAELTDTGALTKSAPDALFRSMLSRYYVAQRLCNFSQRHATVGHKSSRIQYCVTPTLTGERQRRGWSEGIRKTKTPIGCSCTAEDTSQSNRSRVSSECPF